MYKLIKNRLEKLRAITDDNGVSIKPMYIRVTLQENERISTFEMLFGLLSKEEQLVISNDFIIQSDQEWWKSTWSKTTYYKLKHNAVDKFVGLLYS